MVVRWEHDGVGELHRPILVVAFEGLFDVGEAATGAINALISAHGGAVAASIDPETFFDFQQTRPTISIGEGGVRRVTWPENECVASSTPEGQHDLLLLSGIEPHLRWGTFSNAIAEIAVRYGTELVVTLGAAPGDAPHTRPLRVVGSATDADLAERLGIGRPSYQGPTGVIGAIHEKLGDAGIPIISLRVTVPFYVQGAPNPKATQALLRRFEVVTAVSTEHRSLDDEVAGWEARVQEAMADEPEVKAYLVQLEERVDAEGPQPGDVSVADEVEAFLRNHHDRPQDDNGDESAGPGESP